MQTRCSPAPSTLWPCQSPQGWTQACCCLRAKLWGGGWRDILAKLTRDSGCRERPNIDLHFRQYTEACNSENVVIGNWVSKRGCISLSCQHFCPVSVLKREHAPLERRKAEHKHLLLYGVSSPDVKISQHLQVDNGFWDALDAVVVEVEWLEGRKKTDFWGDFSETILG